MLKIFGTFKASEYPPNYVIWECENDIKHSISSVEAWMMHIGLDQIDWPSNSRDMNIIENIWEEIARRVYGGSNAQGIYNYRSVWEAVKREFYNIYQEYILNLYNSMVNRIEAVIKVRGWYTQY